MLEDVFCLIFVDLREKMQLIKSVDFETITRMQMNFVAYENRKVLLGQ